VSHRGISTGSGTPPATNVWRQFSIRDRYPSVKVPVLDVEGWYDAFLAGGTENFAGMVAHGGTEFARDNQRLVIGPWDHVNWGRFRLGPCTAIKDIGPVGESPINDLMLTWCDHFLKGRTTTLPGNPSGLLRHGCQHLEVRDELASAAGQTGLRSSSRGRVESPTARDNSVSTAPSAQPPDTYTYDPAFPVPSLGGHSCCGATGPARRDRYDQSPVEQRSDVLVYSTTPARNTTPR